VWISFLQQINKSTNQQMKTKITIAYKVLAPNLKSCYASCWLITDNKNWSIQYKLNEFVKPKVNNSKLFVFCTLQSAKDFLLHNNYDNNRQIYKCEALNVTKCLLICKKVTNIPDYWKYYNIVRKMKFLIKASPKGTGHADAVKLLERMV
jgi:hypothetical protein